MPFPLYDVPHPSDYWVDLHRINSIEIARYLNLFFFFCIMDIFFLNFRNYWLGTSPYL